MLIPDAFIILSEANLKIASLGNDVIDQAGSPRQPKTMRQLVRTRQLYNLLNKFIFLNAGGTAIAGTFGGNDPALNRLLLVLKRCAKITSFPAIPNPIHSFITTTVPEGPRGPRGFTGDTGPRGYAGLATDFSKTFGAVDTIVDFFPLVDSPAARWDYIVTEISGAQRAGCIIGHWNVDGSLVDLTDSSANDITSGTFALQFTIQIISGDVRLVAQVNTGTSWTVKGSRYFIPNNGAGTGPISDVLPNGTIYIGNSLNVAQSRSVSGVIAITNTGVTSFTPGVIVNADINASAAITLTKLATVTANRLILSNGAGFFISSTITDVEAGYLSGVNNPIQNQLNVRLVDPTTTIGDTIIRNGSNVISRVGIGSSGQVYTVSGGLPTWQNAPGGISGLISGFIPVASSATTLTNSVISQSVSAINIAGTLEVSNGWRTQSSGGYLKWKTVSFTGWNMHTSSGKVVPHGLTVSKIRFITGSLYDNAGTLPYPIGGFSNTSAGQAMGIFFTDGVDVHLSRLAGSYFDSALFNNASGTITIFYDA